MVLVLTKAGEYDKLLVKAIQLRKRHETRARDFVPKMYAILVTKENLTVQDAADRIYKDLAGIWEKDTIRRLLPPEAKNQVARERQALSRLHLVSHAGLILQTEAADSNGQKVLELETENVTLRAVKRLQEEKKVLLEKTIRLERMLTEDQGEHKVKKKGEMDVVMPPHLFMKAYTLMLGSTKALVLKVAVNEVVDVEKMSV